ncbi:hypothetical protein GT037_010492 [Alternaria burnsii]|uniref:Uncharacterized protein n=1 Tax=Alternaria burnsii TaxID=1187904 RepID=A0A8H7AU98_9PLEO|nr:uncharacterized protein GT037_010492 [Alternaria burnsii]KAF7671417.1 hypothetical protein GT037_010492 [Alternaria burnsii]
MGGEFPENKGSRGDILLRGRPAADAGSQSKRDFGVLEAELYYLSIGKLRGELGLGENLAVPTRVTLWSPALYGPFQGTCRSGDVRQYPPNVNVNLQNCHVRVA